MIYQLFVIFDFEPGIHYDEKKRLPAYKVGDESGYKVGDESGWEFAKQYIVPALLGLDKSKDLVLRVVETERYCTSHEYPSWHTRYNYHTSTSVFCIPNGMKYSENESRDTLCVANDGRSIEPFYSMSIDCPTVILCSDEMPEEEKAVLDLLQGLIPDAKKFQLSQLCECLDKTLEFRKEQAELLSKKQNEFNEEMVRLKGNFKEAFIKEVSALFS